MEFTVNVIIIIIIIMAFAYESLNVIRISAYRTTCGPMQYICDGPISANHDSIMIGYERGILIRLK